MFCYVYLYIDYTLVLIQILTVHMFQFKGLYQGNELIVE